MEKIKSLELTGGGGRYEVEVSTNDGRFFTILTDDDFTFDDVKQLVKTFNESVATLQRSGLK